MGEITRFRLLRSGFHVTWTSFGGVLACFGPFFDASAGLRPLCASPAAGVAPFQAGPSRGAIELLGPMCSGRRSSSPSRRSKGVVKAPRGPRKRGEALSLWPGAGVDGRRPPGQDAHEARALRKVWHACLTAGYATWVAANYPKWPKGAGSCKGLGLGVCHRLALLGVNAVEEAM